MRQINFPETAEARGTILDALRTATKGGAVSEPLPPSGLFVHPIEGELPDAFVENLERVSGRVILADNISLMYEKLIGLLDHQGWINIVCPDKNVANLLNAQVTNRLWDTEISADTEVIITGCEALVADTGTILVSSAQTSGRQAYVYGQTHIVIASDSQIFATLSEAMEMVTEKYRTKFPSIISAITGPSRTADIEKTLILGAHGPKALYVFLYKPDHNR